MIRPRFRRVPTSASRATADTPAGRLLPAALLAVIVAACTSLLAEQALPQQALAQQAPSPVGTAQPVPQPNPQQNQAQPPSQRYRSNVDVVSLNVTVLDQQSRYITDLEEAEFAVFEDGTRQQLMFFNRSSLPIAVSLLIDTSASMESRLPMAQEAAVGFARTIRAQDLGQVIDFDSSVQVLQSFTSDAPSLERAIRSTDAGGSTSLHNALYISLKELAKIKPRSADEVRRRAIIVLSDGEDTSSLVSYEEVLELAKRSETAIFTIALQEREAAQTKGFREAEFVLRQFAQETGGRAFFPSRIEDLRDVYGQIANELSSQYSLGYASTNPRKDGGWRRVNVQVVRGQATARTKRGYYAPLLR